jgi:thermospermine synthase
MIDKQRAKSSLRYVEDVAPGLKLDMTLNAILHTSVSDVQSVQVIDTFFGKTLVTDGKTQSSAYDEAIYHESLVHPALFTCAIRNRNNNLGGRGSSLAKDDATANHGHFPKTVLIGGGGELATAREVLRHISITSVTMVDIDPSVVQVCKTYLPEWGGDAVLRHPKLRYFVGDARTYVQNTTETYDVIIMDVSDPIEYGPAEALYNVEFYTLVKSKLNVGGVFVTQAGSAGYVQVEQQEEEEEEEGSCLAPIRNTLAHVFDVALVYTAPVASFGEDWGFVLAYDDDNTSANDTNNNNDDVTTMIDELIEQRIVSVPGVPEHDAINKARTTRMRRRMKNNGGSNNNNSALTNNGNDGTLAPIQLLMGKEVLHHYDSTAHIRMFALNKSLRIALEEDTRIMTEKNPIYMY